MKLQIAESRLAANQGLLETSSFASALLLLDVPIEVCCEQLAGIVKLADPTCEGVEGEEVTKSLTAESETKGRPAILALLPILNLKHVQRVNQSSKAHNRNKPLGEHGQTTRESSPDEVEVVQTPEPAQLAKTTE